MKGGLTSTVCVRLKVKSPLGISLLPASFFPHSLTCCAHVQLQPQFQIKRWNHLANREVCNFGLRFVMIKSQSFIRISNQAGRLWKPALIVEKRLFIFALQLCLNTRFVLDFCTICGTQRWRCCPGELPATVRRTRGSTRCFWPGFGVRTVATEPPNTTEKPPFIPSSC